MKLCSQEAVRAICKEVEVLAEKCGKPKMVDAIKLPPPELYRHVEVLESKQAHIYDVIYFEVLGTYLFVFMTVWQIKFNSLFLIDV